MGEGFRKDPFSRFDPGSAAGGVGGGGGGKFRGGAVTPPPQGGLPQTFVIRRLGPDATGRGWQAHIENLPPGMRDVPLPFTLQMPLQRVIDELIKMGHIVQIGD